MQNKYSNVKNSLEKSYSLRTLKFNHYPSTMRAYSVLNKTEFKSYATLKFFGLQKYKITFVDEKIRKTLAS